MELMEGFLEVQGSAMSISITIGVKNPSVVTIYDTVLMDVFSTRFSVEVVPLMTPAAASQYFMITSSDRIVPMKGKNLALGQFLNSVIYIKFVFVLECCHHRYYMLLLRSSLYSGIKH